MGGTNTPVRKLWQSQLQARSGGGLVPDRHR